MGKKSNSKYLIFAVYIIGVLSYINIVRNFTIPVHLHVDEELYISLAKSFHYDGNFSGNGNILNYTCVLYSIVISLAYFFYTPESIVFLFRVINVLIMVSSVFPVYCIGRMMLKDDRKALLASVFLLFMPSMMDSAYCMQEVMAYPLFLWVIYFIFKEIGKSSFYSVSGNDVIIAIISALCYFTKTYMIFIPLVYCMFVAINAKTCGKGYKKSIGKIAVFVIVLLIMYLLGKYAVFLINDGIEGTNHYSTQFSQLFPISYKTVISAIICSIIYAAALLFIWGILPIVLPLCNIKNLSGSDKRFFAFTAVCIGVLIVEIVLSIVLTEEGNVIMPSKICYRYFQIFEMPIMLIFTHNIKNFKIPKLWLVYIWDLGIMLIYFAYIGDRERHAIIDAPLLLLMENITRYIIPNFNIAVCILAAITVLATYVYSRRRKLDVLRLFVNFSVVFIVAFFVVNLFQLPYYTNTIADGENIQNDSIALAHYLKDNGYKEVVFVKSESDKYEAAVYAYLESQVISVLDDAVENTEKYNGKAIIMSANNMSDALAGFENVDIGMKTLRLLQVCK